MTKSLHKENFPAQYGALSRRLETHERSDMQSRYLTEINTSGKTDKEIDAIVLGGGAGEPGNGILISDPTNNLLLLRQSGVWKKVKLE
jgi:hypothetical protein